MPSYITNTFRFLIVLYTLLLPSTLMNAFADGNVSTGKTYPQEVNKKEDIDIQVNKSSKRFLNSNTNKEDNLQKSNDISEPDTPNVLVKNIQTASNILSSSPSELAEQAKSYALSRLNSTVASEAQKWLSQFGTARINFGLDKKGTLENNSLDLLLPLYDNKADWLLFSQFGYRNKDSRNTINVGLGGRYFYQNWMYGLNTFYDHDLTGKNQRLGLGGEIWGDYIKLSANTYYRLSDWQKSQSFKDYQERPADGYDINGEFFLPAYPNLGTKLTYEQYFGDNVTLFNRDTKQKNPSLAKLGLTYTPIPLFTMGVDYKQGESGHTETQFLANLNYKLGVPLGVQLSPENVASMRTLAGSRYDLVERNNNIVLEHKKTSITQLSLPETIIGYSYQQHEISARISSDTPIKQIHWTASKDFEKNGGKISSKTGQSIQITLPRFLSGDNKNNNYAIYALAELNNNQKSELVKMNVIVRPYKVKISEEANFIPSGPLPANNISHYTFNPVITFDTGKGEPLKNATIDNVQWISEPDEGAESGLKFSWNKVDKLTTDEHGYLTKTVMLTSQKPIPNVNVYLKMEGELKQLVGTVSFNEDKSKYHIENNKLDVDQSGPLPAGDYSKYTYTATIVDGSGTKVIGKELDDNDVKWSAKDKEGKNVPVTPIKIDGKFKTNEQGQLQAILSSPVLLTDVEVSLSIEKQPLVSAQKVSFYLAKIKITSSPQNPILPVNESYELTAEFLDKSGKIQPVSWTFVKGQATIKPTGENTAKLTSNVPQSISVQASIDNGASKSAPFVAEFRWPIVQKPTFTPASKTISPDGTKSYVFTAKVFDPDGKTPYTKQDIKFKWKVKLPYGDDQSKTWLSNKEEVTAQSGGILKVSLYSIQKKPVVTGAQVCLYVVDKSVEVSSTEQCAEPVDFENPVEVLKIQKVTSDFKIDNALLGDGNNHYNYTAYVTKASGEPLPNGTEIDAKWDTNLTATTYNNKDEWKITNINNVIQDGKITATLTSQVGVGDIQGDKLTDGLIVKLEIPQGTAPAILGEASPVAFLLVAKEAWIHVFSDKKPQGYIYKEQNKPYNTFMALKAQLLDQLTEKPISQGNDRVKASDNLSVASIDSKGIMSFYYPGKEKVEITVMKPNKAKYSYTYDFNIKKLFLSYGNTDPIYPGTEAHCTTNSDPHNRVRKVDMSDLTRSNPNPQNIIPLTEEFPKSFFWGILYGGSNPNISNILIGTRQEFIYDLRSDTGPKYSTDIEGYVLCVLDFNIV
ncbi:inverse autotransporter beta domain-containing protein [Xenorhabdus lircayensis]|uniref:Inverse autotransporter beta domain-containing protein n=1 Tax=Xenorhabdus lircayensis TaxID=2763499 RepID=A0ABS0U1E1_9GAMM|nr:inverse autotransporter beta domain-containing protein [Xenorhabdus lircayensis]MBI6547698.1 inverse autotransporter beta domain-containing protein [Xenorhabdus lircayensis]